MDDPLDDIVRTIDTWGAAHAAAAVLGPDGVLAEHGDPDHVFRWASVTKLVTAWTVLVGVGRGLLDLDGPAGPPGSTVRHLLGHASGLGFEGDRLLAAPGTRRIYSNAAYDLLGAVVAERSGTGFGAAMAEWVTGPLGMTTTELREAPSAGLHGSLADLVRFAEELRRPTLLAPEAAALTTSVAFPGLKGVVPGVGSYDPCDWGLGPELRGSKAPHWTAPGNSPATYGHFGGSGTFLWIDPDAGVGVASLTDREFGPWALEAWPAWSGAILEAVAISGRGPGSPSGRG